MNIFQDKAKYEGNEPENVCLLLQVQERFEVDIKELPEQIDTSTYSEFYKNWFVLGLRFFKIGHRNCANSWVF